MLYRGRRPLSRPPVAGWFPLSWLAHVPGWHRNEVLAILDFNQLAIRNCDAAVALNSREFVIRGNAGLLLYLQPGYVVGVKFHLHLLVPVDLYKDVDRCDV